LTFLEQRLISHKNYFLHTIHIYIHHTYDRSNGTMTLHLYIKYCYFVIACDTRSFINRSTISKTYEYTEKQWTYLQRRSYDNSNEQQNADGSA